jgi:hypothetical protein
MLSAREELQLCDLCVALKALRFIFLTRMRRNAKNVPRPTGMRGLIDDLKAYHSVWDAAFRKDGNRTRKGDAPECTAILRHIPPCWDRARPSDRTGREAQPQMPRRAMSAVMAARLVSRDVPWPARAELAFGS